MSIDERRKELLVTKKELEQDLQMTYDDFVVYCVIKGQNYSKEIAVKKLDKYINERNKLKAIKIELQQLSVHSNESNGRARNNMH